MSYGEGSRPAGLIISQAKVKTEWDTLPETAKPQRKAEKVKSQDITDSGDPISLSKRNSFKNKRWIKKKDIYFQKVFATLLKQVSETNHIILKDKKSRVTTGTETLKTKIVNIELSGNIFYFNQIYIKK